jgi:hypothetical protein
MEKFSTMKYKLASDRLGNGWSYEIYADGLSKLLAASQELFDSRGTARYAAIGHITLLENALNNARCEHS